MHTTLLPAAALALLLQSVPAQQADTVVVAARGPGAPATTLYDVALANGLVTPLPTFPLAVLPPLALAVDPVDHALLLALDQQGQSLIVKLRPTTAGFTELVLGVVPGSATDLLVDRFGDLVVATTGSGGGVHRVPRLGGTVSLVRAQPDVTAMAWPGLAYSAMLGLSGSAGPPATDPGYAELDLTSGQFLAAPTRFPGFLPRGITGLVDLPTAVPRQVFAHDDGSFSLFSLFFPGNPVPLPTVPVLPPGAAVAMKNLYGPGLVLGGNSSPFLRAFDPVTALGGSLVLAVVAGPLPGDPVDYALRPAAGVAETWTFRSACGTAAELAVHGAGGRPRLGNLGFGIALGQGVPAQPALLALGFDELGGVSLPNGCNVWLVPAAAAFALTDPSGDAQLPLPVPNAPWLVGTLLFAQWFQDDLGVPFATSPVLAVTVGN